MHQMYWLQIQHLYVVDWDPSNLDDNTYDSIDENTFSPRIFLRGANIYTGFEYTPNDKLTGA